MYTKHKKVATSTVSTEIQTDILVQMAEHIECIMVSLEICNDPWIG